MDEFKVTMRNNGVFKESNSRKNVSLNIKDLTINEPAISLDRVQTPTFNTRNVDQPKRIGMSHNNNPWDFPRQDKDKDMIVNSQ
jgi:hypothetical protein